MGKNNWINTTLLAVVIAMLGWFFNKGFDKMDTMNTSVIEMRSKVGGLESQITDFRTQLATMVTRGELALELKKRDDQVTELKSELNQLRRQLSARVP